MNKPNYKKIYAMKAEREKRIQKVCPGIPYKSGIYAFVRDDESGLKMAYIGQAKSLCERCASHLAEYDHIGLSLKKRGFFSPDNIYGWKLAYKCYPESELDDRERVAIKNFGNNGWQLYNSTSGGQGKGKTQINEYKPQKGYRQGVQQGKKMLARELSDIAGKHLEIGLKPEKQNNKTSQKMFEKFQTLMDESNYE